MHELGIAMEIVEIACAKRPPGRIRRVVVEVGKLTAVFPDALKFAFECAVDQTPIEGAALDIVETQGDELRIIGMEVA